MAAYASPEEVMAMGIQLFVSFKRGDEHPPTVADVRVKYDQTVADLKANIEKKTGIKPEHQMLFHHGKQMRPEMDGWTMLKLDVHTGFGLSAYDTSVEPVFFPPVRKDKDGYWEHVPANELRTDGTPLVGIYPPVEAK